MQRFGGDKETLYRLGIQHYAYCATSVDQICAAFYYADATFQPRINLSHHLPTKRAIYEYAR